MNLLLPVLVALLVVVLGVLSWFYVTLHRRLGRYNALLRKIADGDEPVTSLPENESGLEKLSSSVRMLALTLQNQTSSVDAERAKLSAVLERMTDGVLIADPGGRVQYANPAVERLFGSPNPAGRTVVEVLRQHQLVAGWQRCQQSREQQTELVELPGRRQFLQMVAIPDQDTAGSLLLIQDLTRVRRLETIRRDFISNLSHELRTPLASLKALTETLRDGALDDPRVAKRFLGRIETEVDALTQMATELLELTRIESGQVPLELKAVHISDFLNAAADRMRAQVERAGLSLRVETTDHLPDIRADAGRLEQVIVNLIHNAIKFTSPGGEVVLSAQVEDYFVSFSVQDTGVGIPEDELERIFERFYKADRARSGGGTGLGLSIARHIIGAHGGKIWADSVEGRGSTFNFTIPLAVQKLGKTKNSP